jgi:hypothetical protein
MTNSYLAVLAGHQKRLRFAYRNLSGGGVTNVSDRVASSQTIESCLIECVGHVTHCAFLAQLSAVRRNNATRFLTSMLQCVQAQVRQTSGIGMAIDPEDPTLVPKFVLSYIQLTILVSVSINALSLLRISKAFNP